jgi:hypothetical protein
MYWMRQSAENIGAIYRILNQGIAPFRLPGMTQPFIINSSLPRHRAEKNPTELCQNEKVTRLAVPNFNI